MKTSGVPVLSSRIWRGPGPGTDTATAAMSFLGTYLLVWEKIKKALPTGMGRIDFLMLISDKRRGRAVSIFTSTSSSEN